MQAARSSHAVPSGTCTAAHAPVAASQVPTAQAESNELQSRGAPWQTPPRHDSLTVQRSPSLQAEPSGRGWLAQTSAPSSQTPSAQLVVSCAQLRGAPTHEPAVHRSAVVQNAPSSQPCPSFAGAARQRWVTSSQVPRVHAPFKDEQSLTAPVHTPAVHTSFCVQKRPSLHAPPSLRALARHAPPASSQTPALQVESSEAQLRACPPPQTPAVQVSPTVQYTPSLHAVPLVRGTLMHAPVLGSHSPRVHAVFSDEQSIAAPPQVPELQASPVVHRSPSSQACPWLMGAPTQRAVLSLQVPAVQAELDAEQSRGPPLHSPAAQVSPVVQKRPSSQAPPSFRGARAQTFNASSHTPRLQVFDCAEQSRATPATQAPAVQESPVVQNAPSSHAVPLVSGTLMQAPVAGSHSPRVHWVLSDVQSTAVPAQVPELQESEVVQRSPSSQLCPWLMGDATQRSRLSLQVPAAQAEFNAEQSRALPLHVPAAQRSVTVQ